MFLTKQLIFEASPFTQAEKKVININNNTQNTETPCLMKFQLWTKWTTQVGRHGRFQMLRFKREDLPHSEKTTKLWRKANVKFEICQSGQSIHSTTIFRNCLPFFHPCSFTCAAIFSFQALPRDSSATSSPSSPSNGHSSEQSQSPSSNPILEKFKLPSSEPLVQGENHYRLRFDQLVQYVKKVHARSSFFQLNGHTQEFHPETQKLEPPSTAL